MKKIILISLMFTFSSLISQSLDSDIIVEYELKYRISKVDTSDIRQENFYLILDKNKSEFVSKNKYLKDSITSKANSLAGIRSLPKSKFNYSIVKNRSESTYLFIKSLGVYMYKYNSELPKLDWRLSKEVKKINGMDCGVAYTNFAGRDYVAYYSKEISIQDGPYKFYGLPGLIVEIRDTDNDYVFKMIGLKKYETYSLNTEDYEEITKEEYAKFIEKVKEKPSILFKSNRISFPKEALDKIDRNHRKKMNYENNPIELL